MLISRIAAGIFPVSIGILGTCIVSAQDYPNKVVRIVVSAPGGGADFVARQIAQGISAPLGQPVIVEYRGSGILSAEYVSKAPPDGYTLHVGGSILWIAPLQIKSPYDPVRDFSPISLVASDVNIVAVHPSMPVKSIKELIAMAKARPGELNYSAGVSGSASHLATELFRHLAGVNIKHVPYKGNAPAVLALIAGETHMGINDAGLVAPHVKSGKLRALAVTSAAPSPIFPGFPTVAASGVPGYEAVGRTGIWAPGKTPAAIINRLNQEVVRALRASEVKEKFFGAGMEILATTPEQFAGTIKSEMTIIGRLIKDIGIKVE